jgi:uncharacterized protein (TIGR02246 family)
VSGVSVDAGALERLIAIEEIRALIARYCLLYDDKDWDAFAQLWTEDAAFVVDEEAFEPREVMLEFLTTCLPDGYDSKHLCGPSLIEVAADGCSATAKTDVVWIAANFENTIVGRYVDDLVRVDGGWRFRRRHETPIAYRPGPPPQSDAAVAVSGSTMRTPSNEKR